MTVRRTDGFSALYSREERKEDYKLLHDNIDYNSSLVTAKMSFDVTSVSLIQHPTNDFKGYDCDFLVINKTPSSLS